MDYHKLYEKAGEIASPPIGGSQNQDTFYALRVSIVYGIENIAKNKIERFIEISGGSFQKIPRSGLIIVVA